MSEPPVILGGPPLPPTPTQQNLFPIHFSVAMPPGTPVAPHPTEAFTATPANATNGSGVSQAFGIVVQGANGGDQGLVRFAGPMTLPESEWAAVLDTGSALTKGAAYYASTTPGKITKTAPVGGNFVSVIGYALSANSLHIAPQLATSTS